MDMPHNTKSEQQPLISDQGEYSEPLVYRRRWYILAIFSLACMTQASIWNTWGPIAESLEVVFGWSDGLIALLPSMGNISFFLLVIPGGMFMDAKGLRFAMVACAMLLVICTGMRCFTLEPGIFTPIAFVSSLIHGAGGVLPFSGPALVAAVWFPVEERPIATAIGSFFNYFGMAISFIIGPALVPGPRYSSETAANESKHINDINYEANSFSNVSYDTNSSSHVNNLQDIKSGITNLIYVQTGLAILVFLLLLVYFPPRPPHPPSITASMKRTDYKAALGRMFRNGPLWIITLAAALPVGISGTWIAVIDVILKSIGVSQRDAGWMGFFNTVTGCLAGIFIAKYSSFFHRRRKIFLSSLFICAVICAIWLSLLCDSVIPYSLPSLYASCILIGIFINGTIPLFYDTAAEASFPVGEGVTGAFLTSIYVVFGTIFLGLASVPNISITWLNWLMLGCICASVPLLLIFPERYKRSDIDMKTDN